LLHQNEKNQPRKFIKSLKIAAISAPKLVAKVGKNVTKSHGGSANSDSVHPSGVYPNGVHPSGIPIRRIISMTVFLDRSLLLA
jgi:hypothetical protein